MQAVSGELSVLSLIINNLTILPYLVSQLLLSCSYKPVKSVYLGIILVVCLIFPSTCTSRDKLDHNGASAIEQAGHIVDVMNALDSASDFDSLAEQRPVI